MNLRGMAGALLLTMAVAPGLSAQSASWGVAPGHGTRIVAGSGYETYSFATPEAANIRSLSLFTTSLGARVPLPWRGSVGITGRVATGNLVRADGAERTVSGLTDTEVRVAVPFGNRRFATTVTGILLLPTGHATHREAEAEVKGLIAADLLPFRISHWGSGGGAGLNVAAVRAVEGGSIGLSAGYIVARQFEPDEQLFYRPGNQLQVRAALDRAVGTAGKATVALMLQNFSDDALDGTNLFRPGNRYQVMGSYAFAVGARSSAIVYTGGVHRAQGTALLGAGAEAPAQNLFLAGGGLRIPVAGATVLPSLDTRLFRSADGVGQGYLAGAGAAAEWPLGEVVLVPSLRVRFGRVVVVEDRASGIRGLDIGLAARFGGVR